MMSEIKSHEEAALILGESKTAWEKLVGYIRFNYVMDELWTAGKDTGKLSAYRDELKLRRGGKTLVTMYVRECFFKICIVLERVFEPSKRPKTVLFPSGCVEKS